MCAKFLHNQSLNFRTESKTVPLCKWYSIIDPPFIMNLLEYLPSSTLCPRLNISNMTAVGNKTTLHQRIIANDHNTKHSVSKNIRRFLIIIMAAVDWLSQLYQAHFRQFSLYHSLYTVTLRSSKNYYQAFTNVVKNNFVLKLNFANLTVLINFSLGFSGH